MKIRLFQVVTLLSLICAPLATVACTPENRSGPRADVVSKSASSSNEPGVTYRVLQENIYDQPIKTQIEQHIVVDGVPSAQGLETEIERRYAVASQRRGFKHHNPPTNVYLYVYSSEEQARAGQELWLGMVAKGPSDRGVPAVQIHEERRANLSKPSEARFGLSAEQRRQVYRETIAAERRATDEAMARVPDSEIMRQIELERELQERYTRQVREKYDLTDAQLTEIAVEAYESGWPR